jgi:hypothetical protein
MGHGLNAAVGRDFLEFDHVSFISAKFEHEVDPVEWVPELGVALLIQLPT